MNQRLTAKDKGLIRGAIRRAFSRSALRIEVINESKTDHKDLLRPRVKTWCKCGICLKFIPKSYMVVDHISPVIPVTTKSDDITFDDFVDRLWCAKSNLQAICKGCHDIKTKAENKERRINRKSS